MAFGEYSSLSGSEHTKPARFQVRWLASVPMRLTHRTVQVISNGDLLCFCNKGSCRWSFDASSQSVAFGEYSSLSGSDHTKPARSQGEVVNYTIPNKKQRTHYSWCEGWWPIRRVIGKQRLSSAMNMTRAEALTTPCVPLLGHILSCVPFSGHTCFPCAPIPGHRCVPLRTCDYAPLTGSPNWCCRCIGHCASGWLGLLWRIAHECPSSECGDMLLTHPRVLALIRRRQPQCFVEDRNGTWNHVLNTAGSQYPRSMRQLALCDASL